MSTTPTGGAGRVLLIARRRPGYVGRVHSLQLLAVELALFAALAAFAYGVLAGTTVAVIAAAVAGVTFARWRGRWLLERRVMAWRYGRRKRLARAACPPTTALSVLRRLSPDLRAQDIPVPGGHRVGVAQDDAGWFAAAAIVPGVMTGHDYVPLDLLAASIAEADQAGAVVQVVVQAEPPAAPPVPNAAEQSYHALLTGAGAAVSPTDRITLVVLRIDARGLAEAIGDHNADVSSAPAVLASLLRRLATSLRQAGIVARMLDSDELVASLSQSCDGEPCAEAGTAAHRERWSGWRSSRLTHRTFWIRHWPPVHEAAAMFTALFAVPTAMTTLSLVLDSDPRTGLVDLTALVRVSAVPAELSRACRAMRRAARGAKADLFALDGEQAPATYACAPTGGGAR